MARKKSHLISKSTGLYYAGLNDNDLCWTDNPEQAVIFDSLKETKIISNHLYITDNIQTELIKEPII